MQDQTAASEVVNSTSATPSATTPFRRRTLLRAAACEGDLPDDHAAAAAMRRRHSAHGFAGAEDRFIAGWSAPTFVGTPEQIAQRFVDISGIGVDGMMLGFHDYAEELAYFDANVMPLLRQAGVRT